MHFHLWSLAAFLRDVCGACRPPEPEPVDELPEPLYHAVVSEMAEALADMRAAAFGDEDFAEWSRELMFEGES